MVGHITRSQIIYYRGRHGADIGKPDCLRLAEALAFIGGKCGVKVFTDRPDILLL